MISVKEALDAVENSPLQKIEEEQPLSSALLGNVLAQALISPFDLPHFDLSAMDGYAVKFGETDEFILLEKEITAGNGEEFILSPGEAVRIFTGAPCPASADAIVMQEQTEVVNDRLKVSVSIKSGQNIRRRGEEIKKGEKVLQKGQLLNPAALGLTANLGIDKLRVYRAPNCGVLTTGDELSSPGKELTPGKIYDSNSYLLEAFLSSQNIKNISKAHVPDDLALTKEKIGEALQKHDILLISGGISVGDYDFVKEALLDNGVEEIFHKVKQKPGKPLYFGRKDQKFVFGLPGNPASALSNAYLYVLPLLNRFKGREQLHLERSKKRSQSDFQKKPGRSQFLKAKFSGQEVNILEGQGSAMLQSFAESNALVFLPEESTGINKGDTVEAIDLRSGNIQ
ncbi:MAG: molybdopterin molybdotransferase MoeA [Tetragenococcus koreensis]|nr:molybdopterin molybdotransferase MoeA [Tetragenococcus koreensis]MDN6309688.1 molybdopterin molybdotransferase MoeA [Psychroflexus sp.]